MPGEWGRATNRFARHNNSQPTTGAGSGNRMFPARARTATQAATVRGLNGGDERGTYWTPYGSMVSHPFAKAPPYSLMAVTQSSGFRDSYEGHGHGQASWPGGQLAAWQKVNLPKQNTIPFQAKKRPFAAPTPQMVFIPPIAYGLQTKPIYALGLP